LSFGSPIFGASEQVRGLTSFAVEKRFRSAWMHASEHVRDGPVQTILLRGTSVPDSALLVAQAQIVGYDEDMDGFHRSRPCAARMAPASASDDQM